MFPICTPYIDKNSYKLPICTPYSTPITNQFQFINGIMSPEIPPDQADSTIIISFCHRMLLGISFKKFLEKNISKNLSPPENAIMKPKIDPQGDIFGTEGGILGRFEVAQKGKQVAFSGKTGDIPGKHTIRACGSYGGIPGKISVCHCLSSGHSMKKRLYKRFFS